MIVKADARFDGLAIVHTHTSFIQKWTLSRVLIEISLISLLMLADRTAHKGRNTREHNSLNVNELQLFERYTSANKDVSFNVYAPLYRCYSDCRVKASTIFICMRFNFFFTVIYK